MQDISMGEMTTKKKPLEGIIHLIIWIIILCSPFFFTGREDHIITPYNYLRFITVPISFMVVFYVNYLVLIDHYLYTKRQGMYILTNIGLIVITMIIVHLLMQMMTPDNEVPPRIRYWRDIVMFFSWNVLLYILVASLSVALRMTGGWYRSESRRKELEQRRSEAELKNLKSQLNPHFLFNTLNNIYSLIAFSPDRAQEAVHDLSRLLRYVLYDSSYPLVPFSKELDFIRNYVELMRIRLPEHVDLNIEIPNPGMVSNDEIAPLLFISLIENAFKHGISNIEKSFIHIRMTQQNKQISCLIINSYFPKDRSDKSGSGIGLVNLQKRLELLYPNAHTLKCEREGDTFRSELNITTQ